MGQICRIVLSNQVVAAAKWEHVVLMMQTSWWHVEHLKRTHIYICPHSIWSPTKEKTLASFLQPIWNIFIISPILWCCQQQIPKTSRKTSLRCSVVTTILNPPSKKKITGVFFFQIQILTAPRLFGFQGLIIHLFDGFQQETSLRHQGLEVFWEKGTYNNYVIQSDLFIPDRWRSRFIIQRVTWLTIPKKCPVELSGTYHDNIPS